MRSFVANNLGDALEAFAALRPDASTIAKRIFARKAGGHLGTDYTGSRGLRIVGLGACPASPSIVLNLLDDYTVETEYMVVVDAPDGKVCFDSEEAMGYTSFIKSAPEIAELAEKVKQEHYNRTRDDQCDE